MKQIPVKRVLLIDDDDDVRTGTRYRLRHMGYDTVEAPNGEDGLALARSTVPDAVFLDVRMPGMDGLTVLNQLKRDPLTQGIPVIMLSASLVDQSSALDGGARFFLAKPYSGEDLRTCLEASVAAPESTFSS